jgi:glucosamine--fructose-6-phosphate aminotransferase (isomerizing)
MEIGRYLLPRHPTTSPKPIVIAISSSGEVARTLEVVEIANQLEYPTIGLTNSSECTLAEITRFHIVSPLDTLPVSPGLLSYLSSLLAGWALAYHWSHASTRQKVRDSISRLLYDLPEWISSEQSVAIEVAQRFPMELPVVFLGSGPAFASAMFASAKLIEATGQLAWAQDVEEWCHIEYFCDPAGLPLWLLSAKGRSESREEEAVSAAQAIGRDLVISQWGGFEVDAEFVETLAPLILWAGPTWFAADRMDALGERPFRGFAGGRSAREGGGPSRIRSSKRMSAPPSWLP